MRDHLDQGQSFHYNGAALSQRHILPHKEGILRLPSKGLDIVNADFQDFADHKVG